MKLKLAISKIGIFWVLINNLVICVQSSAIKSFTTQMHPCQIIFLYKGALCVILFFYMLTFSKSSFKSSKAGLILLRAFLSVIAGTLFTMSLSKDPSQIVKFGSLKLSDALAISFTEPLIVSILAIVLLKEKSNRFTYFALGVGFIGSMVILRPGTSAFSLAAIFALISSLVRALDNISIKILGKTEKSVTYLFYVSLFSTIFATPLAVKTWQPMVLSQLPWIIALVALYFVHLYAAFKSYQHVTVSVSAPFDFSRLIFSSAIELFLYNQKLDLTVLIGSMIIVSCSVFIVWERETEPKVKAA